MKKNKDLHLMDCTCISAALSMLATEAVRTAKRNGQTKRWATSLLYANAGDVANRVKCKLRIDEKW